MNDFNVFNPEYEWMNNVDTSTAEGVELIQNPDEAPWMNEGSDPSYREGREGPLMEDGMYQPWTVTGGINPSHDQPLQNLTEYMIPPGIKDAAKGIFAVGMAKKNPLINMYGKGTGKGMGHYGSQTGNVQGNLAKRAQQTAQRQASKQQRLNKDFKVGQPYKRSDDLTQNFLNKYRPNAPYGQGGYGVRPGMHLEKSPAPLSGSVITGTGTKTTPLGRVTNMTHPASAARYADQKVVSKVYNNAVLSGKSHKDAIREAFTGNRSQFRPGSKEAKDLEASLKQMAQGQGWLK